MFSSLPNDKLIDWSKFKAFSFDNLSVVAKVKIVFDRVENIVRKTLLVENTDNQHFSFSNNVFKQLLSSQSR